MKGSVASGVLGGLGDAKNKPTLLGVARSSERHRFEGWELLTFLASCSRSSLPFSRGPQCMPLLITFVEREGSSTENRSEPMATNLAGGRLALGKLLIGLWAVGVEMAVLLQLLWF